MATTQRHPTSPLDARLTQALRASDDFFQLVRFLERQHRLRSAEAGRLGSDCPPSRECVRFHAVHHLGFPARAVERLWQDEASQRHHLAVTFMGLTGPTGVLPRHYTTLIHKRARHRDHALADFLDLFNHRLIALYYRAWAKYRPAIQQEEHANASEPPPLTRLLRALAGQQPEQQDELPLYYSGQFSRTNRSTAALSELLADFLEQPVAIESYCGQWLPIRAPDRAVIGRHGRNHRLGKGVLIGRRVWDVQSKFRIIIGPLPQAVYESLLPNGAKFTQLRQLVLQYVPAHLSIELQFLIETHSEASPGQRRFRLGWNTWLQGRPKRTATMQLR